MYIPVLKGIAYYKNISWSPPLFQSRVTLTATVWSAVVTAHVDDTVMTATERQAMTFTTMLFPFFILIILIY